VDLIEAEQRVADAVRDARYVDPVGSETHREVGGPPPRDAVAIGAPAGIVSYEPADLTVCAGAGTTVEELDAILAEAGQESALDPRDPKATIGGTLAVGLSGIRRLRVGPVRDQVLEVRFATADGRLVRGGGPTVKNVTGYDLPRLLVGSFGTLGVITRVILRCRPRPACRAWYGTDDGPWAVRARAFRPSTILWDGRSTSVLLEGNPDDVAAEASRGGLTPCNAPLLPEGAHRGRASLPPNEVGAFAAALTTSGGVWWSAEIGIGTVHLAADDPRSLARARDDAARAGGWMLRETGAPDMDGFGVELPNAGLMAKVHAAFDPDGKLAPGRLRFTQPLAEGDGS
jgi:glycolate oxidase FAD binding subunit